MLVSWVAYSSTLKMEAICSSETSVDTQRTTRRYISEDSTLHDHRCENLKSCNFYFVHCCQDHMNWFTFTVLYCYLLGLLFNPGDGHDSRTSVNSYPDYVVSHPRRQHSSHSLLSEPQVQHRICPFLTSPFLKSYYSPRLGGLLMIRAVKNTVA
jgi:hypothetical protein